MIYRLQRLLWPAICAAVIAGSSFGQAASASLRELADLHPIDAHAHVLQSDPALTHLLERWNLHIVDILVVDDKDARNHSSQ